MKEENLKKLMKELAFDEGKRLKTYKDSEGYPTIGIGHLLLKGESYPNGITEEQCQALFLKDVAIAQKRLDGIIPDWRELDDVRQRAFLNMTFNLGNRLKGFFNSLKAVKARNWIAAGQGFGKSLWAKQVGKRSERIIHMIVTGTDSKGYLK